jgi:hypothetical protein
LRFVAVLRGAFSNQLNVVFLHAIDTRYISPHYRE